MPCDEGRAKKVLEWVLRDGRGDDDFRQKQRDAQAGVATGSEATLLGAIHQMTERHDFGSYVACRECATESPGCLVRWGREILGLG